MSSLQDDWWNDDLALDIHDCLKRKEERDMCHRIQKRTPPFMSLRRYLVDWMALICQKFRLSSNTQHLGVALYDRFTFAYVIPLEDVKALVVCCLMVASKFEEREEKIPKFRTLMLEHIEWELSAKEYLQMELRLLAALNWNVGIATASHFKDFYMKVALGVHDLHAGRPFVNREEVCVFIEKNVNYFLEVSLQDPVFLTFQRSLVAASCFASARICLHISPTWTAELEERTKFSWPHLVPCIEQLLRIYDEDRRATMDTGNSTFAAHQRKLGINSVESTPAASPE